MKYSSCSSVQVHDKFKRLNSEMFTHPEIVKYVQFMKESLAWTRESDFDRTTLGIVWRYYILVKTFPMGVVAIFGIAAVFMSDNISMPDMGLLFGNVIAVLFNFVLLLNRHSHVKLVEALEAHNLRNADDWMVELRAANVSSTWKFNLWMKNFYMRYIIQGTYTLGLFIISIIFHYGIDLLNSPLILPNGLMPYLGAKPTWDTRYYVVAVVSSWCLIETAYMYQALFATYSLFSSYVHSELKIFKTIITRHTDWNDREFHGEQFRTIVLWHQDMIRLNKLLKDYLGLPCALMSLVTSFMFILCLFLCFLTEDRLSFIMFVSGVAMFSLIAILFCQFGQYLEDESDEILFELYNLPWYEWNPSSRKNLLIILMQAQRPLTIDYKGQMKVNMENYKMILSSSYSYFTMFQSMMNS